MSKSAEVKYVDRFDTGTLLSGDHYPELKNTTLVNVDIIDDGEKLEKIPDQSLDFIIGCHFLEHCQNPIGAIKAHLSKLKAGGILYLVTPDKWNSFDIDRAITSFDHVKKDYFDGPATSHDSHLYEWAKFVNKLPDDEIGEAVNNLRRTNYSIHFHVWDEKSLKDFFDRTNDLLGNPFEIIEYVFYKVEHHAVLRKSS